MKKLLLTFLAAMCCTAMMQAEIVYHAKCEPTRQRGFTQDCWEDTETGKIYSDQACTNELNSAKVVQYSKHANGPVITSDRMYTYEEMEGQAKNPDAKYALGTCLMGEIIQDPFSCSFLPIFDRNSFSSPCPEPSLDRVTL